MNEHQADLAWIHIPVMTMHTGEADEQSLIFEKKLCDDTTYSKYCKISFINKLSFLISGKNKVTSSFFCFFFTVKLFADTKTYIILLQY